MPRRRPRRVHFTGQIDPIVAIDPPGEARAHSAPYADDLEYLQDELRWIEARGRRLAADRQLTRLPIDREEARATVGRGSDEELPERPKVLRQRVKHFASEERALHTLIDARRAAGGPERLMLDRLCATCGLDAFERTALLLAAAPCFSLAFEELFSMLSGQFPHAALTVEAIFAFTETPFAERMLRRAAFSRRGALLVHDLIAAPNMSGRYQSPKDLLGAEIEINNRTLGFLLGRTEIAEEFVEFTSLEEPPTCCCSSSSATKAWCCWRPTCHGSSTGRWDGG